MVNSKCFCILVFFKSRPIRRPIRSLPRKGRCLRDTALATASNFFSAAASNSLRLRARSSASKGLRHTTKRSPG